MKIPSLRALDIDGVDVKDEAISDADCLFCKIIQKEIPSWAVHEDEEIYAFHDVHPEAPTHILIVPKKHIRGVAEMGEADETLCGALLFRAKQIADLLGLKSYRLVFNSGAEAGQSVFHLHLHLLGGRRMKWPPG